jgi:hypothetical protein
VKAKNAAGWGDYSTLDRPLTLKPDSGTWWLFLNKNKIIFLSSTIITRYAGN